MKPWVKIANLNVPDALETYLDLLDQYAQDPMGGGQALSAEVKRRLARDLPQIPHGLYLLAGLEKDALGFATCFFAYSTFRAKSIINLHDIAVLPDYRGRGIASALLKKIEQIAIERGCGKITLEVRDDNLKARHLYEHFGFGMADTASTAVQYWFLEKSLSEN